jgi:hypothetical protein
VRANVVAAFAGAIIEEPIKAKRNIRIPFFRSPDGPGVTALSSGPPSGC